jgi:hypothetical protein
VLEVSRAVLPRRGADRDEDDVGSADGIAEIASERQAFFRAIAPHQLFEPGLVDGDLAAVEHPDFFRVAVDADDLVACFGKTRTDDQPHVARSHDRDPHAASILSEINSTR